jgi:hypothetical protein
MRMAMALRASLIIQGFGDIVDLIEERWKF